MSWLTHNWHDLFGEPWSNILLSVVAVICGSIVGAEREKKEKPAGLRTLTLVCLGSAVFTMISISFKSGDPGRVASQIVTGIGFLGAGAILRGSSGVTGMTTAATIWAIAATGTVVGAGYAGAGIALSVLILGVLTVISTLEVRHLDNYQQNAVVVVFEPRGGKALVKIEEALEEYHVKHGAEDLGTTSDGLKQLKLAYHLPRRHHRELLARLAGLAEVREIRSAEDANRQE